MASRCPIQAGSLDEMVDPFGTTISMVPAVSSGDRGDTVKSMVDAVPFSSLYGKVDSAAS